ncbi:MAG: aminotransferase class V-fold PLP-dependent enzyme, partial [Bacilli bacterium]|jgi:cysteine desulfurase|nr:aminotransferase class V-fold PLP-dependent enzyme [Bacilli bacterium]
VCSSDLVNEQGMINLDDLKKALKKSTILVSIMAVNNETGSINLINEIAALVHQKSLAAFHVDVTQAIGKIHLNYQNIDMFSFSGHKINGLKGSGALVIRKNISLLPLLSGGQQEYGFRSATSSVALASTLAEAVVISLEKMKKNLAHVKTLNNLLHEHLSKRKDIKINSPSNGSPFIFNFSLLNKKASVVVEALSNEQIYVSSFSACQSNNKGFSYVVKALGRTELEAQNTIRVSFDYNSTKEDVLAFLKAFENIIERIKG